MVEHVAMLPVHISHVVEDILPGIGDNRRFVDKVLCPIKALMIQIAVNVDAGVRHANFEKSPRLQDSPAVFQQGHEISVMKMLENTGAINYVDGSV